jgi:hypothetical protein
MLDKRTADQIDREVLALIWRSSETKPASPDWRWRWWMASMLFGTE